MKIRTQLILIAFTILCLGILPTAPAVNPPPDGGYAGGNTAEGQSALLGLTTGLYNTAVGIYSVLSLSDGNFCTVNDVCSGGNCIGGAPKDCNDGFACTQDVCVNDPEACRHIPDSSLCDDHNVCTFDRCDMAGAA